MKKLIMFMFLLCSASAWSMDNAKLDSLSLFDKDTYQIGNLKKLVNWGTRVGFQGAKMYAGMWLFRQHVQREVRYNYRYETRLDDAGNQMRDGRGALITDFRFDVRDAYDAPFKALLYKGSGVVLFLHGLRGLIKECGYDNPNALFKYLESRK